MALLCGVTALLATAPAAATAKPGYVVTTPAGHTVELNLRSSHGYRINIGKLGRYVYLGASEGQSIAFYVVRSLEPKDTEIKAGFPGVGRISAQFNPKGPPQREPPFFPGCHGGETIKQRGHFIGTIRFRGERGYTSVKTTRARGEITTTTKEVCKRSMFGESPDPVEDRTELFAYSRSKGRAIGFTASTTALGSITSFTAFGASTVERRRGMTISRHVLAPGDESQLVAGDTRPYPLSATVTPPAPFHGSAEFQRTIEGDRAWTGSLSVSFPGLDSIALTGPRFDARFCQRSGCHGNAIDGLRLPLTAGDPARDFLSLRPPLGLPTARG
jgi:hypothetical protein